MRSGSGASAAGRAPGSFAAATLALFVPLLLTLPSVASAQTGAGRDLELGGLFRTGLRIGPGDVGRTDGLEIYDARVRASGRVGIVFDYLVRAEWDRRRDRIRLLDASLRVPISSQLRFEFGQLKAPLGKEALRDKADLSFVTRSQASQLLAPGRQVGVQGAGEALQGRLRYAGGLFNGNGRSFENDDDSFLYAGRVEYNHAGTTEFYDELVVEVGANLAFSRDSAVDLGAELERDVEVGGVDLAAFRGDRLLWGGDLRLRYREFVFRGEYLRADLDGEGTASLAPGMGDDEVTLEGGYLEAGYYFREEIEGVARWDVLDGPLRTVGGFPVDGNEATEAGADFLVVGLNVYPDYQTKIGLQYVFGLAGTRVGPGLADNEFRMMAQIIF